MVGDPDVEEGEVIVHEDGAGFALFVDTEHLDLELLVICCAGAGVAAAAFVGTASVCIGIDIGF